MKRFIHFQHFKKPLASALFIFFFIQLQAQNPRGIITINTGVVFNIGKDASLVTNSHIDNKGTLTNAGTIILNGDVAQSFPGSTGNIPLMNVLEVKNSGSGIALNKAIKIDKELRLTNGNLALGNYDVTIRSTANQTAAIPAIGNGAGVSYGTGKFIIERYINVGTVGHSKSWQLLSVPANGQTIKDCWMEAGAATSGYGTQLTNPLGATAGYDLITPSTSIKTYVSATNTFDQGPSSTSSLINNNKGYMLFVRGDRTVASGTGTAPTTLRIKGTIFTPTTPPSTVTVGGDKYESIGNPYASQIDFTQLTKTGGVDNTFYTWDPSIYGFYGVGGYQTISATNSWVPVPGGGTYAGAQKTIESGQAFFVHSTGSSGTISFSESAKTGSSRLANKNIGGLTSNFREFIRSTLMSSTGFILDGNAAAFDEDLSNVVNADDAIKIMNGGVNFGLKRENKLLAIEGRSVIVATDTLFYYTNNLLEQPYQLLIVPENMSTDKQAFFEDRYLQIQTPVSLKDTTRINFNVTADPLSSATDRFMLVLKAKANIIATVTTLRAESVADGSVAINWLTANEKNIKNYMVEKSKNGTIFNTLFTQNIITNKGSNTDYSFQDKSPFKGNNFYRIKTTFLNGSFRYSNIVKVEPTKITSGIGVYPNPATGKILNLNFSNETFGKYHIVLTNSNGQKVWSYNILYNNSAGKINVELPKNIPAGNYHLTLINKEGKIFKQAIVLL